MAVGEDTVRVVGYIDKDLLEALDRVAAELGASRSGLLEACIESGLDDLRLLSFIGLTPGRLRKAVLALRKIGILKVGGYEIDVKKALKKQGLLT